MTAYLRDPKDIYRRSFEIIRAEADVSHLAAAAEPVAVRVIHACGMPEIAADLQISADFASAAGAALAARKPVLTDSEMLRHGLTATGTDIICTLNDPAVRHLAESAGTTRSAAAVALWGPYLDGAVAVIGNAPTALFALLEAIDKGAPKPAAIVAFPVGFVGAAESKEALLANPRGIPYATLLGRRGGSAMAAAAVNALTLGAR